MALHPPDYLFVDEATASLDEAPEVKPHGLQQKTFKERRLDPSPVRCSAPSAAGQHVREVALVQAK